MATALRDLGVRVGVACQAPSPRTAPQHLRDMSVPWPKALHEDVRALHHAWRGPAAAARRRLAKYQGRNIRRFAGIIPLVQRHQPAVVIALGQHGPLLLRALADFPNTRKVWYAADEPVFFQLSCLRRERPSQWRNRLSKIALYAGLETLFVRGLDGAIGVSPLDTRLLRLVGGVQRAVTIRNGVDLDYFTPQPDEAANVHPRSLVFWGRMDFEPNADAVIWFAKNVWPTLRHQRQDATWQIVGKNPLPSVQQLSSLPGVQVLGEVPDIRPHARSAAVTILPVRCGGGIKNKLLEAAAMGRPIAASPKALQGLAFDQNRMPALVCDKPEQWVETIRRLWSDPSLSTSLRCAAQDWVRSHHTWPGAARQLKHWLESMPGVTPLDQTPPTHTQHLKIRPAAIRKAAA